MLRHNDGAYVEQLMDRIREVRETEKSNCIGTALYLVGEEDRDFEVSCFEVYDLYLKRLKQLDSPALGTLIAWQEEIKDYEICSDWSERNIHVYHMGVVTCVNPILITHRKGDGPVAENEGIERAGYTYHSHDVAFYVPRAMLIG